MENYTFAQAHMAYGAMMRARFDAAEEQARLVWAVMNGWKRPKPPQTLDEAADALKAKGVLTDG